MGPCPDGIKPIGSKWVFDLKRDKQGIIDRFNARLVALGFAQKYGIDFIEVFSPVAKFSTFRYMMAISVKRNYFFIQPDIKSAFLNGELKEEIYMQPPPGLNLESNMVLKLRKALYGIKQAARAWSQSLELFLFDIGFIPSHADRSLFTVVNANLEIFILFYVDDILIFGTDKSQMEEIVNKVTEKYITRRENSVDKYLGIIIDNVKNGICLHSKPSIIRLLENFQMENCLPSSTVLPHGFSINRQEIEHYAQ